MSEIPEIVALRRDRVFEPYPEATHLVRLDDAERELRSALDRQAREIVEALRANAPAIRDAAVFVESRFAPKEADPPAKAEVYSHPDCVWHYCPNPEACDPGCTHPRAKGDGDA